MSETKQLNLIISNCEECPYSRYDGSYNTKFGMGSYCEHDDVPYSSQVIRDSGNLIFDPFPEWCPLPSKNDNPKKK